jgi:replication-associated recombination protein RarA
MPPASIRRAWRISSIIVVFDEAHDLTGVQAAPLKIPLENLARSVYVFFLTDQPELFLKRDAALQSRVSHVHIPLWSHEEITELLANMVTNEYEKNNRPLLDPSALAHIANIAAGNPRRAISSLEIVLNGVASNVSTITAAHVKTYYPDLGELDEADHNNKALLDLFSAIRDSNMEKALGSIAAMEKKRENAVTVIYKVNKYLKNRVVENAARNKTVMLEFARKLRNFGMAFNRDGEPYANLMCGVVAALDG